MRESEWHGHFLLQELGRQIERLEEKNERFPSREKSLELANLGRNKALMEALQRAWKRSVVEGHESPLHMVLLQMDELSHAGLSFDCLNPEDFQHVHRKFPEFVPGPRGLDSGLSSSGLSDARAIDRTHARGQ